MQNGGRLGGTGTVGQTTMQSGGTLGAGNSIGTLNVARPPALNACSILDVAINDGDNVVGVSKDLIAVAGAVTIAPTASVVVRPTNGTDAGTTYTPNTQYTIVTTTGGRTGTFASIADQLAFLDASLGYDANNV